MLAMDRGTVGHRGAGKADAYRSPGNGRERVFLSLGSNVGRRPDHLRRALRMIGAEEGIRVVAVSLLYSTSPVGYTDQREFLNGVLELRTWFSPRELWERLRGIEKRMGKRTPFRNGPRLIDIDVLLYGRRRFREAELAIPHPRAHARRFVLEPLVQIAPEARHAGTGRTAAAMLEVLGPEERVRAWGDWEPGKRRTRGMDTR